MKKKDKVLILLIVTIFLIQISYIKVQNEKLISLKKNYEQISNKLKDTLQELDEYNYITNSSIFGVGSSVRKFFQLTYLRTNTTFPPSDTGNIKVVIYIINDNTTLHLKLDMNEVEGLSVPLTIQKGDHALTPSPVVWDQKVAKTYEYNIILEEGFYTISLSGPWSKHGTNIIGLRESENGVVSLFPLNLKLGISTSIENEFWSPFIVYDNRVV